MTNLSFTVLGKPATKGSTQSYAIKRGDGSLVYRENGNVAVATHDANPNGGAWAQAVGYAALRARAAAGAELLRNAPFAIDVAFYETRGKGHYGTGRNAGRLLPSAPMFPAKRPDVDKQLRAILDPLTGVIWADDGQVVMCRGVKLYGDPARAEIRVWSLLSAAELPVELPVGEQAQLALVA